MVYVFANFLVSLLKRKSFSAHRSERHTAFSSNDHETLARSLNSGVSFSSSGKWDDNHRSYLLGFSREMKALAHANRSENSAGHADSTTHGTFNPPGTNCWSGGSRFTCPLVVSQAPCAPTPAVTRLPRHTGPFTCLCTKVTLLELLTLHHDPGAASASLSFNLPSDSLTNLGTLLFP